MELSKSNNWSGSFDNLDAKKDGKVITYTIKEEKVKKYKSTITGDATLTFIKSEMEYIVKKTDEICQLVKTNSKQHFTRISRFTRLITKLFVSFGTINLINHIFNKNNTDDLQESNYSSP